MARRLRWIIWLPAASLAWFAPAQASEPQPGLTAVGYTITEIPPEQSDTAYEQCGEDVVPFINVTFDYEQNLFGECGWDQFMIHYTGFIEIPEHETLEMMVASDDGGVVSIGDETFGNWQDQGCMWTAWMGESLDAGVYPVDAWFYENGGATCFMLAWKLDDAEWTIVPPEAFTRNNVAVTTTTTVPETTTTVPETTTTTVEERATTTLPETTTSSSSTTTTTQAPPPPAAPPTPTTTEPEQTVPQPTPTEPETTVPSETTTTTEDPPLETETTVEPLLPPTSEETNAPEDVTAAVPEAPPRLDVGSPETTTETTVASTVEETIPDADELDKSTTEEILTLIEDLDEEQVQEVVAAILEDEPTQEQAVALATSPQVLATVTTEQAEAIFEVLDVAALDETQVEELIAAVQDAPTEVRETFEATVDIFKNALDTYVPTGSNIPVGERRALIAIGAAITAAGAATRIRR